MGYHSCPKNNQYAVKRYCSRVSAPFNVSMILCLDLAQTWVIKVILDIINIGIPFMTKNDWFGVKCHRSVQFGAFQRFHDAMLGCSSNLGYKGYFRFN